MRKYIVLLLAIMLLPVAADAKKKDPKPQETDSLGRKIKTGWNFGILPSVAYDADYGFQGGVLTNVYYYGTLINGSRFDGNFTGFSGNDKRTLDGLESWPTEFNSPTEFTINGSIIAGWKTALQHMREGERWMVYIPYQSGYGKNGRDTILGYSTLCFDMIVDEVIRQ